MSANIENVKKKFLQDLNDIAEDLEINPALVTFSQFKKYKTRISEDQVVSLGGFAKLKKHVIPQAGDLEVRYGAEAIIAYTKKLEKKIGETAVINREVLKLIKEHISKQGLVLHKPYTSRHIKAKSERTLIACISDTHFGANVSKSEMHGANEYNWVIAARRLALYMDQVVKYKLYKRKETDLVLQLNGDIIAGLIHNQEWFVDLYATQFSGSVHLLSQAISYVAQHFKRVTVVCTPGNHGRNVGKLDKGRATTQKWDSFETTIYSALREIFSHKHKNVDFIIPESPYIIYKVQGHNIFQTHGDTVLNFGNPGKSLNMKSITDQVNQINSSPTLTKEENVAVVCGGHVHVPTVQMLSNGCTLVINGCLSGTDPFAQSIGIFSNNPTQVLFEVTDKHPVGDSRFIQVDEADELQRLDKIIKPFKGKL